MFHLTHFWVKFSSKISGLENSFNWHHQTTSMLWMQFGVVWLLQSALNNLMLPMKQWPNWEKILIRLVGFLCQLLRTKIYGFYPFLAGRDGSPGALQLLQQRTWLLHWSLFIFFNGLARGKELLIELFLHNPDYTHAVQTMAPWLLR